MPPSYVCRVAQHLRRLHVCPFARRPGSRNRNSAAQRGPSLDAHLLEQGA